MCWKRPLPLRPFVTLTHLDSGSKIQREQPVERMTLESIESRFNTKPSLPNLNIQYQQWGNSTQNLSSNLNTKYFSGSVCAILIQNAMLYFVPIFRLVKNVTLEVNIFEICTKPDPRTLSQRSCTLPLNFGLLTLIAHDAWLPFIQNWSDFVSVFNLKRNKSINIKWDFYNFLE